MHPVGLRLDVAYSRFSFDDVGGATAEQPEW
jgi:hypothetical protein